MSMIYQEGMTFFLLRLPRSARNDMGNWGLSPISRKGASPLFHVISRSGATWQSRREKYDLTCLIVIASEARQSHLEIGDFPQFQKCRMLRCDPYLFPFGEFVSGFLCKLILRIRIFPHIQGSVQMFQCLFFLSPIPIHQCDLIIEFRIERPDL